MTDLIRTLVSFAQNGPGRNDQHRFAYTPLSSHTRDIRLLALEPDQRDDTPIHCNLCIYSLDANPRYTALSYVWGDPRADSQFIVVNGALFEVPTSNLADALRHLRQHFRRSSWSDVPSLIWIDFICINQDDVAERTSQINLLPRIYASATYMISWLGNGDPAIKSAIDFIGGVAQASYGESPKATKEKPRIESASSIRHTEGTDDQEMLNTVVDPRLIYLFSMSSDIPAFFSLAYWRRLWIVQELVLARPNVNLLVYGQQTINFRDVQVFRDAWLAFLKQLQLIPEWESILSDTPGWDKISDSWTTYIRQMETTLTVWSYYDFLRGVSMSGDSLFYIILGGCYQKADSRDSVYGLLNLVNQTKLVPDYRLPAHTVYTQWFTTVLADWGSLEPLYFAGSSRSSSAYLHDLPSWVPDLSTEMRQSPVWDATLALTIEGCPDTRSFWFSDGTTADSFSRIFDGRMLQIKAMLLDTITSVSPLGSSPAEASRILAEICRACVSTDGAGRYQTGIPILRAIFRALMCGVDRFSSSQGSSATAVVTREYQVAVGSNEFQLAGSMPLLQAVAKFLAQRGLYSPEATNDAVLRALCVPSKPLGSDLHADARLAAAFVALLLSGLSPQATTDLLRDLALSAGPGMI